MLRHASYFCLSKNVWFWQNYFSLSNAKYSQGHNLSWKWRESTERYLLKHIHSLCGGFSLMKVHHEQVQQMHFKLVLPQCGMPAEKVTDALPCVF